MNGEYQQSREDLELHLKETIEALQLSSKAYDEGFEGEAKRLAAAIRVLVHDTDSSKSLLGQLGKKSISYYDTSLPRNPENGAPYNGLAGIDLTMNNATYKAFFEDLPPECPPRWVSFDEWWNRVIFLDNRGGETTRKELICAVANKDGGAHVDPVLSEKYANLSRRNSLGWSMSSPQGSIPLKSPEKASVRQITYEILKSLNPEMHSIKPSIKGMFIGELQVIKSQPTMPKAGRKAPCPCGSGKKYKHCHGKISFKV
jgi:hypothetical protein